MGIDDRLPSQDCRAFRLGNLSIANNWGGIYSKKYVVKIFIEEGEEKNFEQLETTLQ